MQSEHVTCILLSCMSCRHPDNHVSAAAACGAWPCLCAAATCRRPASWSGYDSWRSRCCRCALNSRSGASRTPRYAYPSWCGIGDSTFEKLVECIIHAMRGISLHLQLNHKSHSVDSKSLQSQLSESMLSCSDAQIYLCPSQHRCKVQRQYLILHERCMHE